MIAALLDTSLDSNNDGDKIIVAAVLRAFPELRDAPSVPTHRLPTDAELDVASRAELLIVTGTNLLSAELGEYRQWPLGEREIQTYAGKVVFLGVGWWQYQDEVPAKVGELINRLRHPAFQVSARDEYTRRQLASIGVPAVSTDCPTMWALPAQLPPLGSSSSVVFTVTDYNPAPRKDRAIIRLLARRYQRVYVWPQGDGDQRYLSELRLPPAAEPTPRGLDALRTALAHSDYIGTRLHAGIFAADLGRPSLVLAVDNRGIEIGRDTHFPVVPRVAGSRGIKRALDEASYGPLEIELHREAASSWQWELRSALR